MLASWISINAPRMDIVSFSYPYYSTGVSFVYRVEIVDEVCFPVNLLHCLMVAILHGLVVLSRMVAILHGLAKLGRPDARAHLASNSS